MMEKYLKYKNKYLLAKNQIAGRFEGRFEGRIKKCLNNGFKTVRSIGFEYESKHNFIPLVFKEKNGKIILKGTGRSSNVILEYENENELILSSDTTVVNCNTNKNNTIFSLFNYYTECESENTERQITPYDFIIGDIQITNNNGNNLICHPEFIYTHKNISTADNLILEKNWESIEKIREYFSKLGRIRLYNGNGQIKTVAHEEFKNKNKNKNSLINKLIRIEKKSFTLTSELIDETSINKVVLLIDRKKSRAFIVYSYEDFSLDDFLNPTTNNPYFLGLFYKNFFSQLTVGSYLGDLYKIIGLIEEDSDETSDKSSDTISSNIISILCTYKKKKNISDNDISILFLIIHYLFYFLNPEKEDYKFAARYSIRHFYDEIFEKFGYNDKNDYGKEMLCDTITNFVSYMMENQEELKKFKKIEEKTFNPNRIKNLLNDKLYLLPEYNKSNITVGEYMLDLLYTNQLEYNDLEQLINNRGKSNMQTAWGTVTFQIPQCNPNSCLLIELRGKSKMLYQDTKKYLDLNPNLNSNLNPKLEKRKNHSDNNNNNLKRQNTDNK